MGERPNNRKGRQPLLKADAETLELICEFGRRGLYRAECARRLDVCPQTFRKLLREEPAAARAFADGKAERLEILRAGTPGRAEPAVHDAPKSGETCPTCGQRLGFSDETVIFTTAELAGARRDFENLIDRHLAARDAAASQADGE